MKSNLHTRLILACLLLVSALPAYSAGAYNDLSEQLASSTLPTGKIAPRPKWSTKKKIATAVVVGCVIAAAVAIPVAVGIHHRQQVRRDTRRRNLAELVVSNQEIAASRQEQAIRSLLSQGATLSLAQQTNLQTSLSQVQQAESVLNLTYHDLVLHKSLSTALSLDHNATAVLSEYDGYADFPVNPWNVLIESFLKHH
jgi:hypothetical protein